MVSTHPKNISQIGNLPQVAVKRKITLQGTNISRDPPKMALWRWISFSQGGICYTIPWRVPCVSPSWWKGELSASYPFTSHLPTKTNIFCVRAGMTPGWGMTVWPSQKFTELLRGIVNLYMQYYQLGPQVPMKSMKVVSHQKMGEKSPLKIKVSRGFPWYIIIYYLLGGFNPSEKY